MVRDVIFGKRLVILSSSCLKEIREEDLVVVKYTHASTESVLHIAWKEGNLVVMGPSEAIDEPTWEL